MAEERQASKNQQKSADDAVAQVGNFPLHHEQERKYQEKERQCSMPVPEKKTGCASQPSPYKSETEKCNDGKAGHDKSRELISERIEAEIGRASCRERE